MNDTIGIFYETPDGRIVKTYAWNGGANTIYYYTEHLESGCVSESEWSTWQPRRDLGNFKDSDDPLLPRIFYLLWKLRKWSDLNTSLQDGLKNDLSLRNAMESYGLTEQKIKEKLKA